MHRLCLVHWNKQEASEKAERLRAAGFAVDDGLLNTPAALRELRDDPPAAVVIDLTRLPSHGREVALTIRQTKSTRHIPLVFVEGDPEKIARIQQVLPDAVYTTWGRIRGAIKNAIAHPPENPRVPSSVLEGYSGTPLPKKLGIKPDSVIVLMKAPDDFEKTLGALPEGARLVRKATKQRDLTLWFIRSRTELENSISAMRDAATAGGLWIIWPKKTSKLAADMGETEVRALGLAAGLVDYKVCAVDATWSGLKFSVKRSGAGAAK